MVDALSQVNEKPAEALWILTMPHFRFLDDLKKELSGNVEFVALL